MTLKGFGIIDNRFLAKSIGLLNPKHSTNVSYQASVADVVRTLQQNKIGCVCVTNEKGALVGIFSERDLVLKVCLKVPDLDVVRIADYMTANPQSANMTTTIAYALTLMSHGGFRHLPLTDDDGVPVGMVSVKDIIDYIGGAITKDLSQFEEQY